MPIHKLKGLLSKIILMVPFPSGHYNIVDQNFQVLDIVDVLKGIIS
jgi:hypothetical protein